MFKKRDAAPAMFSGVKYAMQYFNMSIYIGLFYRYLTGTLFLLVPGMKCTKKEVLTRDSILYIGLVALLSAMTAIFLYSAYVYIAAGVASTIHYLYPFFVILGNWFFFHRPLKKQILTATMISFTGLVLLCAPSRMEGGRPFCGNYPRYDFGNLLWSISFAHGLTDAAACKRSRIFAAFEYVLYGVYIDVQSAPWVESFL